jgi:hypothetical protein
VHFTWRWLIMLILGPTWISWVSPQGSRRQRASRSIVPRWVRCFRAKKRRQNTQGISKQHVINRLIGYPIEYPNNLIQYQTKGYPIEYPCLLGSIRAEMWWLMTSNIWKITMQCLFNNVNAHPGRPWKKLVLVVLAICGLWAEHQVMASVQLKLSLATHGTARAQASQAWFQQPRFLNHCVSHLLSIVITYIYIHIYIYIHMIHMILYDIIWYYGKPPQFSCRFDNSNNSNRQFCLHIWHRIPISADSIRECHQFKALFSPRETGPP